MSAKKKALLKHFKKIGGLASYAAIIKAGFHNDTLQGLVSSGCIQKLDGPIYKLTELDDLENPDLVIAAIRVPKGVICLISSLAFYEVTDEIPRNVDLAIPRGTRGNKIEHPPVKYHRFSHAAWKAGIETKRIGGQDVRIYSLAKTLADCFKFRNKIGADVARDALKTALNERKVSPNEIMKYAKICRVVNVIQPILESLI